MQVKISAKWFNLGWLIYHRGTCGILSENCPISEEEVIKEVDGA